MTSDSRLPGFYKKPPKERLNIIKERAGLTDEEAEILAPMRHRDESADHLEKVIRDAIALSVDGMIESRLRVNHTKADSLFLRSHLSDSLRFEFDMIR